jgi:hypothetical protein
VRLIEASSNYWIQRGHLAEGYFWAEKYLEACQQHNETSLDIVGRVLSWAGTLAYFQADLPAMRRHVDTLLPLATERQDKGHIAVALF